MVPSKLLIANRGEIAIRIARAAAELGIRTVAVFAQDDAAALHTQMADKAQALRGSGVAAYLDMADILTVAQATGCEAIHSGYGFLSENAAFARRCAAAHITFVGPRVELLELFGDKIRAGASTRTWWRKPTSTAKHSTMLPSSASTTPLIRRTPAGG
jgi:acetyl/propionyl-CoA carboxylase alpha subunit